MSIQILQYEFHGPILLEKWGPPMEELVYLILSRQKDSFNIVYVGDCQRTDEMTYFEKHPQFDCWSNSGAGKSPYLAILPMPKSSVESRKNIIQKIITFYKPACNEITKEKPSYAVRGELEKFNCPCCGSKMNPEKILEKSTIYRCTSCGISDSKLR